MPDPNLPVPPPPGTDWAIVKPWLDGAVATLVLIEEGVRLDDYGHTIDDDGMPVEDEDPRVGQIIEVEVIHWGGVRRASKRALRKLAQERRAQAAFDRHRAEVERS